MEKGNREGNLKSPVLKSKNRPATVSADLYTADSYQNWILSHSFEWCSIDQPSNDTIYFRSEFGDMEIRFYDENIVEISIFRKKDTQLRYYLHFELKKESHAKEMFNDMLEALYSLHQETTLHILLSCTSGATTSFLASKLNQLAKKNQLDWHFSAVPYLQLIESADQADLILIAPQIGYLKKKIECALPGKLVFQIPTPLFSGFDASGTIDYIRHLFEEEKKREKHLQHNLESPKEKESYIEFLGPALLISVILDSEQLNITLRYYENGKKVEEAKAVFAILKRKYLWQEISYMLRNGRKPEWIVLAIPGIVDDESLVTMKKMNMDHFNLAEEIERRYSARCLVVNNVNACALGCSHWQPDLKTMTLISFPYGCTGPGVGTVIDGKILSGRRGLAGECKFYMNRMQFSNSLDKLSRAEEGHYEMLIATILPLISFIDPDIIYMRTPLIQDMKELAARLTNYIAEEYIPKLVYLNNPLDEVFLGLGILISSRK
ncbi:ROK family protein [Ileibacterium valens]|uniref:PTS EIIB type-3 domain-containing protein n=2 Tax=Ileibacterium valens TaxID=1862668 RepID=A0A1U7NCE9_9FIRM|nr:ROK family protein [Ileibacterium valens]OLU36111.1 hypothetical protein BO222_12995 [Ileibacterium valens]OLU36391.1 hypothetical protein BM735_12390 [Erysipelotrichaceae bacterium NYU-BL-F16]OLU43234.1 hypothetical protein BO224_00535 [Erysipelotrichaceae bacterium NYU-BL-E8]